MIEAVNFTFFLLIVYLSFQLLRAALFFVYIWQVKEYRIDRLWTHLFTLSGQKQLVHNLMLWEWKKFFWPKPTLRIFLTLCLTFIWSYNLFFSSLKLFYLVYEFPKFKLLSALVFSLTVLIIAIPIIVSLSTIMINLLTWPFKESIHYLAYRKLRNFNKLLVIGVTGSYGKSSTKEIVSILLASNFKVIKTPFNCNTKTGIALFILRHLRSTYEIVVIEMGAYKLGEIKDICKMIKPQVGIVTGINEQHLSLFGSLVNTKKAKYELIRALPKNGLALFNGNNKIAKDLYKKTTIAKKLYGLEAPIFKNSKYWPWYDEALQAGIIIGKYLGIPERKLLQEAKKIKRLSVGLKVNRGFNASQILDDSYNSNPVGFRSALGILANTKSKLKIIITPGIIELGKESKRIHCELGKLAFRSCQKLILTKADFYTMFNAKRSPNFVEVWEDPVSLWDKLKPQINRGTTILLEGRVPGYIKKQLIK